MSGVHVLGMRQLFARSGCTGEARSERLENKLMCDSRQESNGLMPHDTIFSACFNMLAILLAVGGVLVERHSTAPLPEIKLTYFWLALGTTAVTVLCGVVGVMSLSAIYSGLYRLISSIPGIMMFFVIIIITFGQITVVYISMFYLR